MLENNELDIIDKEFLLLLTRGATSSYEVWSNISKNPDLQIKPMAYNNVNRRLLILHSKGFLEELEYKDKVNIHGRKDFKLTMQGLEQLIPYLFKHPEELKDIINYMNKSGLDKSKFVELLTLRARSLLEIVTMYNKSTGIPQSSEISSLENIVSADKEIEIKTSPTTIDFSEYLSLVSTFNPIRPPDKFEGPILDTIEEVILDTYVKNGVKSVEQIFASFKSSKHIDKSADYSIPKRIGNLVEYQFIEPLKEYTKKDIKFYKISEYGLIYYIAISSNTNQLNFEGKMKIGDLFLKYKDTILFRSLILQFFDTKTIEALQVNRNEKDEISETLFFLINRYLDKCCYDTYYACQSIWTDFDHEREAFPEDHPSSRYPSFPSDEVIQKYMQYLGGKSISNQQSTLNEIEKYNIKINLSNNLGFLLERNTGEKPISDPKKRDWSKAPYPLGHLYNQIFNYLRSLLEENNRVLTFNIISYIGNTITSRLQSEKDINRKLRDKDSLISRILTDEKFIRSIVNIRNYFDTGVEQFMNYSHELNIKKREATHRLSHGIETTSSNRKKKPV